MTQLRRNPWTGFWEKVPEPRWASVWQSVTYGAVAVGGAAGIIDPPTSIATQVSVWMMTYWAFLLAFGGAAGAVAVMPGLFWLERFAIVACGFGFVIYVVAIWGAWQAGGLNDAGNVVPIVCFVVALFANIVGTRWARVRHGARDPERFSTYGKHKRRSHP